MRTNRIKAAVLALVVVGLAAMASACGGSSASVASANLSQKADDFQIERRIVFYNGITDRYMFTVEGRCSIKSDNTDHQLEVTCKTGPKEYKKHFLGLSDNVTYFVEQTQEAEVDVYHYAVLFKPETIVPDVVRPN